MYNIVFMFYISILFHQEKRTIFLELELVYMEQKCVQDKAFYCNIWNVTLLKLIKVRLKREKVRKEYVSVS